MATWAKTDTPGKFRVRASIGSGENRRRPVKIIHGNTRNIERLAAEWEASLEADPAPTKPEPLEPDDDPAGPTFTQTFRAYIDATATPAGWSPKHRKDRERALEIIDETPLGSIRMGNLRREHLGAHLSTWADTPTPTGKRRGPDSVNHRKTVLAAVVNYARADPDTAIRGNPAAGLSGKIPSRTVAERDIPTVSGFADLIERAAAAMEDHVARDLEGRAFNRGAGYRGRPGHRDRAEIIRDLALFALFSGLRQGEVCAVRSNEVTYLEDGSAVVLVRHSIDRDTGDLKKPKNGKHRSVTVPQEAAEILLRRHGVNEVRALTDGVEPPRAPFVFSKGWGEAPIAPDTVRQWWERLRDFEPGLAGLRFHDLRHSHSSELHAAGEHDKAIAEHMGHSVEVSRKTYNHIRPGADAGLAGVIGAARRR